MVYGQWTMDNGRCGGFADTMPQAWVYGQYPASSL
jgi:hypothetical protein